MRVKNVLKKVLIFTICCSALCSLLVGCGGDSAAQGSGGKQVNYFTGKGVHQSKATDRSDYLVSGNETDYKIVLPVEYKEYEMLGATLIQEYVEKATGAKLPIVSDDSVGVSDRGKFLSVGDTTLMRASGISIPYDEFGNSGFKIVTKNNIVYMSGARSPLGNGSYYAAQEFLAKTVNLRIYAADEIKYDRSNYVRMKDYQITEIPEFDERRISFKSASDNQVYTKLLRLSAAKEGRIPYSGHSHLEVLPPEIYYEDHKDWYWNTENYEASDPKFFTKVQLCMTNMELREEFVNQVVRAFQKYPDANFVHLGIQDSTNSCMCDNCKNAMIDYGTNYTGLSIMFTNDVARRVQNIIWESEPDRMLTFETFAYYAVSLAPVHEENGVMVPDCEEVIADDNVMIQFAPLTANASETFDHQKNKDHYTNLKNWSLITKGITTWCYGTNFTWLLITHKDWDTFISNALLYSQCGVQRYYSQNAFNNITQPWEAMKLYVQSKLLWDVTLDYNVLLEDFIENYYGDAAPYVLEAYTIMSTYYEYLRTELDCSGTVYLRLAEEKYWSFAYVENIRKIMMQAFASIEPLKTRDTALYQKYTDRLELLYVENLFMQMEFHREEYSAEYGLEAIEWFGNICSKFNITHVNEVKNDPISGYITKWSGTYA